MHLVKYGITNSKPRGPVFETVNVSGYGYREATEMYGISKPHVFKRAKIGIAAKVLKKHKP